MTGGKEVLGRVYWLATHRIVRGTHGSVSLVDDIAGSGDWEALYSAARTTRFATEYVRWQLDNIPADRRVNFGASSSFRTITGIMGPFLRCSESRFSEGDYGVWYGCGDERTALAETVYHYREFMQSTDRTRTQPASSEYEGLLVKIDCELHDVNTVPKARDPVDYRHSRKIGARLRGADSNGVMWNSVRHPGGQCVGLFWPAAVGRPVREGARYIYHWTGMGDVVVRNLKTDETLHFA